MWLQPAPSLYRFPAKTLWSNRDPQRAQPKLHPYRTVRTTDILLRSFRVQDSPLLTGTLQDNQVNLPQRDMTERAGRQSGTVICKTQVGLFCHGAAPKEEQQLPPAIVPSSSNLTSSICSPPRAAESYQGTKRTPQKVQQSPMSTHIEGGARP